MSNRIKGLPRSVVQNGDRLEIWVESPTGDSSDSQILEIQCLNEAQCRNLFQAWVEMAGLYANTVSK
jgi:hypothetical protein